jgi:hypothetical protein
MKKQKLASDQEKKDHHWLQVYYKAIDATRKCSEGSAYCGMRLSDAHYSMSMDLCMDVKCLILFQVVMRDDRGLGAHLQLVRPSSYYCHQEQP